MKLMERDIEIMGWVLEQKFMTRKQIRKVFWKDLSDKSTEDYRRLNELRVSGYLKTSKRSFYKEALYLVTGKGVRQLKDFSRNRGLWELADADYSNYKHDLAVTDMRIMFQEWGYKNWVSERILSRRDDLRRVPDGMIFNRERYTAVEYESSQKSKSRYREIFYQYELDGLVDQVLYLVDTPELVEKLVREASVCNKIHFVATDEVRKDQINSKLITSSGEKTLHEFLEAVS